MNDPQGRRAFLQGALATGVVASGVAVGAATWPGLAEATGAAVGGTSQGAQGLVGLVSARPIPLAAVRLLPSPWYAALQANRAYVLSLSPDRLLSRFRSSAGLPPRAAPYGGWEGDTIAGHTLGHYLTALALLHAQTGEAMPAERARYVVDELLAVQAAHGDGYVGGFLRKRLDGTIVDGKELFAEVRRGDIRVLPFDLNGCWVPLYNWHKLFDGLFHVQALCGDARALGIATALAGYIDGVFAALNDDQVQHVLDCEHGGINESLAELHARTGDARWLALAERLYHQRVLGPLAAGRDELAGLHANTQVPKLIGLARLHELTAKPHYAKAARYFREVVMQRHSYVIGGNSDREYFQTPDTTADYLTEETCEGCNTYNMLKLTRAVWSWEPSGQLFDDYERAHLNHVLAQQNPHTGRYTYMMPLMSGVARDFSTAVDSFWCCVGSGMESHAKHGDSIWWEAGDKLFLNLFIPAEMRWERQGLQLRLTTRYPEEGRIRVEVLAAKSSAPCTLALRIPGWAQEAQLQLNGRHRAAPLHRGYAEVHRRWRAGDVLELNLPLDLRLEAAPGDERTVAVLRGPLVLAADLGPASEPYDTALAPALVGEQLLAAFSPLPGPGLRFATRGIARPRDLEFVPFYSQWTRRSAVYFRRHTDAQWEEAGAALQAERARLAALDAQSLDHVVLGDEASEKAHGLESDISYAVLYRGRRGRDARTGGLLSFQVKVGQGPVLLRASYWGEEKRRRFHVVVEGERIASVELEAPVRARFIDKDYVVPEHLTHGKERVTVRFDPEPGYTAGPVFGVRVLPAGT